MIKLVNDDYFYHVCFYADDPRFHETMNKLIGWDMADTKLAPKPRRNRRGEKARREILQGTIGCLQACGYAQTSIEMVMTQTGFSRGSVLHQFPTRHILISSAIDVAMQETIMDTRERFGRIEDPETAYRAACDVFWETFNIPQSAAVSEALLASRWDHELAKALQPVGERAEREIDTLVTEVAAAAGATNIQSCLVQSRTLIVSLRGMTFEQAYSPGREIMLRALDNIRAQHLAHCDAVLRNSA